MSMGGPQAHIKLIRRDLNDDAIGALGWARRERWLGKAER